MVYRVYSEKKRELAAEAKSLKNELVQKLELKNGRILWPVRVAVSGKAFTPGGGVELAYILGKDETLRRIDLGIEQLSKA